LRAKAYPLRRGLLPWFDSDGLREQIDSNRFLSAFNRAIATQTVHVLQGILLAPVRPLKDQ
jgi:hypothetical protein